MEECNNSPTFTLVAAVRGEDEVREGGRVYGRDVVLVEVMCGVEFACKPLECGWRVIVACFTEGEDVRIVGGGELTHHAPLVSLRDSAAYVEGHGFEV
jgi:hypothetical protein